MNTRLALPTGLLFAISVASLRADESKLPTNVIPPTTAYARASIDGKTHLVIVKLVEPELVTSTEKPKAAALRAKGWREVKVDLLDPAVQVHDVTGKRVAPDRVVKLLEKETPVLVSESGAVDHFHLLTTKESTLIFSVPSNSLSPPPQGPAAHKEKLEPSVIEQTLLELANAERGKVDAPPLTANLLLIKAARQHSANMARQGVLNHTLDEKGVAERLKEVGYSWSRYGENIARGQPTPAETISFWMKSSGHRENLLSNNFTQIGVAMAAGPDGQPYWTMVLATPN